MVGEPSMNVILTISGMASIYSAYRLMREVKGSSDPVVVFGFPYLDTLKMMQRIELNPAGCHFLGYGDSNDLDKLEIILHQRKIAALITELPSNPLLKCNNVDLST